MDRETSSLSMDMPIDAHGFFSINIIMISMFAFIDNHRSRLSKIKWFIQSCDVLLCLLYLGLDKTMYLNEPLLKEPGLIMWIFFKLFKILASILNLIFFSQLPMRKFTAGICSVWKILVKM